MSFYTVPQKREVEVLAKRSMKFYLDNDKRIEMLTISKDENKKQKLLDNFERLIPHLRYKERFGQIDWFIALVNFQHMHILIRKPYVPLQKLIVTWNNIQGYHSSLVIKTVKKDEENYMRVVDYLLAQPDKHNTYNVQWQFSENFGKIFHIHREKSELKEIQNKEEKFKIKHKPIITEEEMKAQYELWEKASKVKVNK